MPSSTLPRSLSANKIRQIAQGTAEALNEDVVNQLVITQDTADDAMAAATAATTVASGAYTTAIGVDNVIQGVWTAYTPGGASTVGVITSSFGSGGAYKVLGKQVFFWGNFVININGTGAGELIMAAPVSLTDTSLQLQLVPARIAPASSALVSGLGQFAGNNTQFRINKYDGTYPGGNGYGIYLSGTYQYTL